jgi:hypothetical protein
MVGTHPCLSPDIVQRGLDTMKTKKKSPDPNTREAKKAIVMNAGKKRPAPIIIAVIVIIAVAAGLGLFLLPDANTPSAPVAGTAPVVPMVDDRTASLTRSACLTTARPVIFNMPTPKAKPPSAISSSKAPTVLSGRPSMPAMSVGGPAKAIIRRDVPWFAAIAAEASNR